MIQRDTKRVGEVGRFGTKSKIENEKKERLLLQILPLSIYNLTRKSEARLLR